MTTTSAGECAMAFSKRPAKLLVNIQYAVKDLTFSKKANCKKISKQKPEKLRVYFLIIIACVQFGSESLVSVADLFFCHTFFLLRSVFLFALNFWVGHSSVFHAHTRFIF